MNNLNHGPHRLPAAPAALRPSLALCAAAAALWLSGCSSTPVASPPADTRSAAAPAAPAPTIPAASARAAAAAVPAAPMDMAEHLDPASPLARARSVYFGYDEHTLPAQASAVVERHGSYMIANPQLRMRVEGNTDERGGAEYNLALGQKRAEALRQALATRGVPDARVEVVSFGKERPKSAGSTEAAWAENRRADLVYPR